MTGIYVLFRRWQQNRRWRKSGRKWRHASVHVAFERLQKIIREDRATVPCGRWVRRRGGLFNNAYLAAFYASAVARGESQPLVAALERQAKPRCRYEVRR